MLSPSPRCRFPYEDFSELPWITPHRRRNIRGTAAHISQGSVPYLKLRELANLPFKDILGLKNAFECELQG